MLHPYPIQEATVKISMTKVPKVLALAAAIAVIGLGCRDGAESTASSDASAAPAAKAAPPSTAQNYAALADAYASAPAPMGWRARMLQEQMQHMGSLGGMPRGMGGGRMRGGRGMGMMGRGGMMSSPEMAAMMRDWHADMARWHEEQAKAGGPDAAWHEQMMARHQAMAEAWPGTGAPAPAGAGGAELYRQTCAACHGSDGSGVPGAFPPLAGNPVVTGEPAPLLRITLHGLEGETTVGGERYTGAMPGIGAQLDDQAVAKLLTYIRSSWGNDAGAVSADRVARMRAEDAGRTVPWQPADLGLPGCG
jgi:mono/diheme cytochrome c family protein